MPQGLGFIRDGTNPQTVYTSLLSFPVSGSNKKENFIAPVSEWCAVQSDKPEVAMRDETARLSNLLSCAKTITN